MEFRVLGSLEASYNGRVVPIGSAHKMRLVLAALLSRADRAVALDWLISVVWADPPVSARQNVQHYIHRLRAVLGDDRIASSPAGYVLRAEDGLDAARFRRLVAEAREALKDDDVVQAGGQFRAALALWRGAAYAEFTDCPLIADEAARLEELRITAYEGWAEAELRMGQYHELVDELADLVRANPYRESLRGHLMRALYGAGRQADALQVFRETRAMLAEQLGVEPGPQLQRLHERILRGDSQLSGDLDGPATSSGPAAQRRRPPSPKPTPTLTRPAPAQLPRDVYGFTGRSSELAAMDATIARDGEQPTGFVIPVVSGTAGVGKTALAVHWAHRVRHRFPDGQLYIDLRGFDPSTTVMSPAKVIRRFLEALVVAPHRIPADPDAQADLYRTLLADKRVLVVLDNARDPDQVRPLLPGAPGCLVLVTSRNRLTGLIAEGAKPLPLDLLTPGEARDLLTHRLGPTRVGAEPDAVDLLVHRCARLPLALAIVAAHAAIHPQLRLATLAEQLGFGRDRLDALSTGDTVTTDVRTVFGWSYRTLDEDSARLFRLLGLHPGPDISTAAVASLAALPIPRVRPLLDQLAHAHLITEHTPGRYNLHDLLRAYAAEQAQTTDRDHERHAATRRLLDHYLHTAYTAERLLKPTRDAFALAPPEPGVVPEEVVGHEQALAWFDREHAVLLAVVEHAAAGFDAHAWQLAWVIYPYLDRRGLWHDWTAIGSAAVAAARRHADPTAQAATHRILARAYLRLSRFDDAYTHLRHALDLFVRVGDLGGQAQTHHSLANVRERQGRYADALDHARQALDLSRRAGDRDGEASALNGVGWHYALLGEHQQALTYCQRALTLLQESGDMPDLAATWDSLGFAHYHLGHYDDAVTCYQTALSLIRAVGDRRNEAGVLTHLGDAYHAVDNADAARTAWQQALEILTELEHSDSDQVRTKLHDLGQTTQVAKALKLTA